MEPMPFYRDEQIPLKLSPNTETLQPVPKQARNPKAISVFRLNPASRADQGAFRDNHDPIANVIVLAVRIGGFAIGYDHDPFTDAGVLVDNGTLNVATRSNTKRRSARLWFRDFVLVKVRAHQDRVADRGAAFDHATNPDDRAVDVRIGNHAAIGDYRPL